LLEAEDISRMAFKRRSQRRYIQRNSQCALRAAATPRRLCNDPGWNPCWTRQCKAHRNVTWAVPRHNHSDCNIERRRASQISTTDQPSLRLRKERSKVSPTHQLSNRQPLQSEHFDTCLFCLSSLEKNDAHSAPLLALVLGASYRIG
jgi:hypothetical protein